MIPLILAQMCECLPDGVCLNKEQKEQVTIAVKELDEIKSSKAKIEVTEPIIIIRDWEDRIYINGGEKKPIKLKLKIGKTIDRDMEMTLPIQVGYREKPPDPMFRLRIRAQAGFLIPTIFESPIEEHILDGMDAGIGWDFFHLDFVNLSVYTGIRSVGGGLGLDLTKNFGPYLGYSLIYDGFQSAALAGIYFSFN
jgi:hypothetical protein